MQCTAEVQSVLNTHGRVLLHAMNTRDQWFIQFNVRMDAVVRMACTIYGDKGILLTKSSLFSFPCSVFEKAVGMYSLT